MRQSILLILLISVSINIFSQKKYEPNQEDVQKTEFLKLKYPDAHVAIELSEERITFGFNKKDNKVTVQSKIVDKLINIDSRSDIQRYCFYNGEIDVETFTVKYKTGKNKYFYVRDDAYTSDGLFHNDTRVKYINLDFPQKGYKYTTTIIQNYHDIKYFTSVHFNDELPIIDKKVIIEIPNWLNLELKEINFEGHSIEKKIIENSDSKTYTFSLNDVPAIYDEIQSPGPSHIYPHILILPKSHTQNSEKEKIFESTQDLYNWYKSLVNSLTNAEKPYANKVKELTKNAKTDEEKIKNIYYWIQDNIRYIAFEDGIAGFKPDEAYNVYDKKYGDCKGMANLTKQMLIEAGFDARLTWIGTKRIAYDYSTPNLSVDNHMICTLFKDNKTYFLDGTEKFNPFDEYAERIQGKQVLIENGSEYILKKIPSNSAKFNTEIIEYNLAINNDNIEGTANKQFNGERRTNIIYSFSSTTNDKKEEALKRFLNNDDSNIKISNIETSDISNRDIPIDVSYTILLKNKVSSFDDEMYIDLDFDKELSNFSLDKRKTDYIFSHKKDLKSKTILKIPSGYEVSHFPENINVSTKNYDLSINFSKKDNTIVYEKHFTIKNAIVETEDFDKWNSLIEKLNTIYNEQITLIKK